MTNLTGELDFLHNKVIEQRAKLEKMDLVMDVQKGKLKLLESRVESLDNHIDSLMDLIGLLIKRVNGADITLITMENKHE